MGLLFFIKNIHIKLQGPIQIGFLLASYIKVKRRMISLLMNQSRTDKLRFDLFFIYNVYIKCQSPKQIGFQNTGTIVDYVKFS